MNWQRVERQLKRWQRIGRGERLRETASLRRRYGLSASAWCQQPSVRGEADRQRHRDEMLPHDITLRM